MQYLPMDDEDFYRARIHEILDGYPAVVSPFLYEYKQERLNIAPIGEWLYALPAFIFGLSFIFIVYKFLLPAILFFLVYLLVKKMIGGDDREALLTSLTAGLLVTLGIEFVDYGYMLSLFEGAPSRSLLWTRPVNPITGGVLLFTFLLSVYSIMERRRYAYILAGILLAATVGYYFAFGMATAVLGVLFLAYLVRREYPVVRDFIATGIVFLVVSAPYWYNVALSFGGETGRAAAMRAGMIFTHAPVFNKALFAATIIVVLCFAYALFKGYVRENERAWIFIGALIAAGWIGFNEQIITGRQIWYHHFVQYTVPFSYIAVLVASYLSIRRTLPRLWFLGVGTLAMLSIVYGLYSTTHGFPSRMEDFARLQAYGPVMDWLNDNALRDCVVAVVEEGEEAGRWIPAYTHCNSYISAFTYYAIPEDRVLHNYLLHLRLNGVEPENVANYLKDHESEMRGHMFTNWDHLFDPDQGEWVAERISYLTSTYREFATEDLNERMHQYRIDYLMTKGPMSPALEKQLPGLKEAAYLGTYHLYALKAKS